MLPNKLAFSNCTYCKELMIFEQIKIHYLKITFTHSALFFIFIQCKSHTIGGVCMKICFVHICTDVFFSSGLARKCDARVLQMYYIVRMRAKYTKNVTLTNIYNVHNVYYSTMSENVKVSFSLSRQKRQVNYMKYLIAYCYAKKIMNVI